MNRLRKAHQIVAAVLVPTAAIYVFHAFRFPTGEVTRAEATLRAILAVGAVAWTVLWSAYAIGQNQARRPIVARARVLQEATVQLPIVATPVAEQSGGLDPQVMRLGRRIAARLDRAPDVRQDG